MVAQEAKTSTKEIAQRLVQYCRKAEWEKAQRELYAENATSTEPYPTPDFDQVTKGLNKIIEKGRKFDSMVEKMHSLEVSEPLVTDSAIAFTLTMDVTMKGQERMKMPELCLYRVKDGKIVSEEFFV
jgi:ketosteroid isomerase-like protein